MYLFGIKHHHPLFKKMTHEYEQCPLIAPDNTIEIEAEPTDIHVWLAGLDSLAEKTNSNCIPRVPPILRDRESSKKCFDPVVISLGPYHHGKAHLQRMEKYKFETLKRFTDNDLSGKAAKYYKELEEVALEAKDWYEKPINLTDEKFKKMMFVDCCFILNFILEYVAKHKSKEQEQVDVKSNVNSKNSSRMEARSSMKPMNSHDEVLVLRDMMMLENQVPFSVLKKLMSIKLGSDANVTKDFNLFVEIVLFGTETNEPYEPIHLLDLFRKKMLGPDTVTPSAQHPCESDSWCISQTVTELKEAGIICRKGEKVHLKEVSFKKQLLHRVLLLPHIVIDDITKYLFLNMIAYEMGPGGPPDYGIISYICFMDALINDEKDVKELRAHRVLDNALSTDKELADLFNGLATDLISDSDAYHDVKKAIDDHYKSPWVKFRVSLLELLGTYFNGPWATIGFFAGVFLLFLAAVQTFYTVFPPPGKGGMSPTASPPKPH